MNEEKKTGTTSRASLGSMYRHFQRSGLNADARRAEIFAAGRRDAGLAPPKEPIHPNVFREIERTDGLVGLYNAGRGFWPTASDLIPTPPSPLHAREAPKQPRAPGTFPKKQKAKVAP